MKAKTDRRSFLKTGFAVGGAVLLGGWPGRPLFGSGDAPPADLAVVEGPDRIAAVRRAVDLLGGMSKFVPRGGRVGLLVNAPQWWRLPGSHTDTEVVLAAVRLCREAGVREIIWLNQPSSAIWDRSPLSASYADDIKSLQAWSGSFVEVEVKGTALKKARVVKELLDCEAVLNLSIAKDHAGTRFSGCLKNAMGALDGATCRFFHFGSGRNKGEYDDVDFLSQCIAEVNLVRRPSLCLADATVVLATNGPAGPGDLIRPGKVVAGPDAVAVDTRGAELLGRRPAEIIMLAKAARLGLGTTDLGRLTVKEIRV
jgi:uncharacterized protein (DUF362 family)